ncbi:hypothetical protein BV25DRAFT_1820966 [Artomyces pyxidatus]|uniref:Uncharacterized protein n=1 Tax=Artomyces pyxidatus TaxID=48021 RepID=A0ACB8TC03_9AGAM|nr:hypothetical protein BV25DRAFT_1820966 [Artomyces pyxidatus]
MRIHGQHPSVPGLLTVTLQASNLLAGRSHHSDHGHDELEQEAVGKCGTLIGRSPRWCGCITDSERRPGAREDAKTGYTVIPA